MAGIDDSQLKAQELIRTLQEKEASFFRVFNSSTNMMALSTIDEGRIVDINKALSKFLGIKPKDVIGMTAMEYGLWKDCEQRDLVVSELRRTGKIHNLEANFRTKENTIRTMLFSCERMMLAGQPFLFSVAMDITGRERAEQALRESEAKCRALIENSLQGLAIIQDERFVLCNSSFAALAGYSIEELLSIPNPILIIHPDDCGTVQKRRTDRMAGILLDPHYQHRIVRKDGKTRWVDVYASRVEFNGRHALQLACIDITDHKEAEIALRESEERFRLIAETVNEIFWIFDVNKGCTVYLNPAFEKVWGYPRELIINNPNPVLNPIHPDDRQKVLDGFMRLMAGLPLNHEYRLIRPDGTIRYLWDCGFPIMDEDGKIERCVGFGRDVTEWRQTEKALKESQEYFLQILDCIGDPIFVKDRDHGIVLANRTFCAAAKKTKEEVIGKTVYDFLPKPKADIYWQHEENVLSTGNGSDIEEEVSHENGRPGHFLTKRRAFVGHDGKVQLISAARDITEFRRLHDQFLQAQKMEALGLLAGGVAHDFNNLLNVINGYSEMIMAELGENSPIRADLSQIQIAGQRAASLTAQLLAFGRKQIIQPEIINLNEIMQDMSLMLRRLIGENISLKTVAQPDLWFVHADPGQIHQIIMNLAVNARDAMPQGGQLTLEAHNIVLEGDYIQSHQVAIPGPYVMLTVSDNGAGMDAVTQSRLFEPFFTTKEKGKGTGLGLSTVYGIVKQNKGFIWVYSELGKGTTFKVYLPRMEGQAVSKSPVMDLRKKICGSETILVVEDEPSVRILAARILREHGYQVMEAGDGQSAICLANDYKGDIDLVLTDVVMPGMGGKELVDRLTEIRPQIRSLFSSGYTDSAIVQNGILDSNIVFLQKPYNVVALLHKVREILDKGH